MNSRFDIARTLFLQGNYDGALDSLVTADDLLAQFLRIRCYTRLSKFADANQCIQDLRMKQVAGLDEAELAILHFNTLIRLGGNERSSDILAARQSAQWLVQRSDSAELESEFWGVEAADAFATKDLERCEHAAWSAIHCDLTLVPKSASAREFVVSLHSSKARALLYLALVRGSQGRFHEQMRFLREAIVTAKQATQIDIFVLAYLHVNFAFNARDLGVLDYLVELDLIDVSLWPASLDTLSLYVMRAKARLLALQGSGAAAIALLNDCARRRAARLSRDGYWLATVADVAILSAEIGLEAPASVLTSAADELETFDWLVDPEQRFALPLFARALSLVDRERAEKALNVDEMTELPKYALVTVDRRSDADRAFGIGSVRASQGRQREAYNLFADAFEIWFEYGFRWQAADAAIQLLKTGFADQRMLHHAEREVAHYPNSWLARELQMIKSNRINVI